MARVQRARRDSVEQTESRNDSAGGQHVDAEVAARHVIDLLGDVLGEFVENILGGPRALQAHGHWPLRLHHRGSGNQSNAGGGCGLQEFAAP